MVRNTSKYKTASLLCPTEPILAALKCVYLQTIIELNASIVVKKNTRHNRTDKNPLFRKGVLTVMIQGTMLGIVPMIQSALIVKIGGHKKHDCYKVEQTRRDYGNCASEIIEGQLFQKQDAQEETDKTTTLEIAENELESTDRCVCHIFLGASNGKRLG